MNPALDPFPGRKAEWLPGKPSPNHIPAAASLYLAMMTATSLALTGAKGPIIVEGPFAKNRAYLDMLGVAAGRKVFAGGSSSTGTSIGAALWRSGQSPALRSIRKRLPRPSLRLPESLQHGGTGGWTRFAGKRFQTTVSPPSTTRIWPVM